MTSTDLEVRMLERAVGLAEASVTEDGGPFGAVLLTADGRTTEGTNRVTADADPTAHAEVVAIRAACALTGSHELRGAVLLTSCEPCPMCLATALWARIDRVVFAADRYDAARAGFDDAEFYGYFDSPGDESLLPVGQAVLDSALRPFEAWLHHEQRTEY